MDPAPRKLSFFRILYLLVPAAFYCHYARPESSTLIFVLSALGIVPLAGTMGRATEALSQRAGPTIGGLMNATLGNAAELIIALFALRESVEHPQLLDVVKASITGSIIGNVLLVFGLSAFLGGLGREKQRFSRTAAEQGIAMLFLSVAGLVMPAMYHFSVQIHEQEVANEAVTLYRMSMGISIALMVTYFASLFFSLRTHKHLYFEEEEERGAPPRPLGAAIVKLVVSAVLISFLAEFLVGTVEETTAHIGWTKTFVGVVIIAIVGNAAEHSSAVTFALKDNLNLSLTISVESSKQIALFVAPLLVLLSNVVGTPMDLRFTFLEVASIWISVTVIGLLALDGESNWMEGFQLLAVYGILGVALFYVKP